MDGWCETTNRDVQSDTLLTQANAQRDPTMSGFEGLTRRGLGQMVLDREVMKSTEASTYFDA